MGLLSRTVVFDLNDWNGGKAVIQRHCGDALKLLGSEATFGAGAITFDHAISANSARAFWTSLYLSPHRSLDRGSARTEEMPSHSGDHNKRDYSGSERREGIAPFRRTGLSRNHGLRLDNPAHAAPIRREAAAALACGGRDALTWA
jgi:hypothetical protein